MVYRSQGACDTGVPPSRHVPCTAPQQQRSFQGRGERFPPPTRNVALPATRRIHFADSDRARARAAAPIFYALRQRRLPRLPLRGPTPQGRLGIAPRPPPSRSTLPTGGTRTAAVASEPRAGLRGAVAAGSSGRRVTRPRDARRAAAHHLRLASAGLRRWAPAFVPVGDDAGYVPGRLGRPGRKARIPLHRGRDERPHALPSPQRGARGHGGPRSPLVAWAMRLPRTLRAARCSLSAYIDSTMLPCPPGLRPRVGDPLPAPPRPWKLPLLPRATRSRPAWALQAAAHVWTNCIIAALSHLAMGRASVAPPHARGGAPASPAQAAMWDGVHARVSVFLREAKESDGGAKLATAEAEVAELERLLADELRLQGHYGGPAGGTHVRPGDAGLAPFIAADVALPARGGFFDLAAFLPDDVERAAYEDPDTLLEGGDASGEPASRGAPRGVALSSAELLQLCVRLDAAGILALVPADEAEDISPIFAVRKKFDATRGVWSLRLLFDRRRRNERERHLHGASRDLPHAACFLDIVLEAGEHIEIDASDLECFYYTARVSDKRAARNVFGRPLPASKFAMCACYNPALGNRLVVPALATLAMGDRNAVDFAQRGHRELLLRAGALDPGCEVHYGAPLPRSKTLHGVMIDDRVALSLVSSGAEGTEARARATREWDAAMDAYAASCGKPVPEKALRRARAGRVWGAWLDGERGTLGGPPQRRAALATLTVRLAVCGWGTPALLRRLLGSWVFHLMFRRAAFSVLDAAFRFVHSRSPGRDGTAPDETRVSRLPGEVRAELLAIALLSPLLVTDLRAPVAAQVWCADASPSAGAVVRADIPAGVARELWRHRDSRGASPAEDPAGALRQESAELRLLRDLVVEAVCTGDPRANALAELYRRAEDADRETALARDAWATPSRDEWFSELVQSLPFEVVLRYPFRRPGHINILEANVRLSLLKHLARSPANFGSRQVLGQDSQVCLGAFAKGRSSAQRLNHVEVKAGAYELAADLQIGGLWVDSFRMPADAPSRAGGLVLPVPARPWVAAFLAGNLEALDARLAWS